MGEDREQAVELIAATQVSMADFYYTVMEENPMLAKLMMDKMKSFLTSPKYAAMERQTILMRFLEEHTNMDVIHEVLDYIKDCELKDDYTAIIMEWNYHNTEYIKNYYLSKYDGNVLSLNKENPRPNFKSEKLTGTKQFIDAIVQITTSLFNNENGENGDNGDVQL